MRGHARLAPARPAGAATLCDGIFLKHAFLALRPQVPSDDDFLDVLLRDECGDAYGHLAPTRDLLNQLIRNQRQGETERITRLYRGCEPLIILKGTVPIGRLTLAHEVTEYGSCLRIADMALLRYHQSRGYGRSILCDIVDSARRMRFYRVNVTVFAANVVFIRLLKVIGFRAVGTLDPTSHQALMFPLP